MLCENCHQNPATVMFTQVVNQQKRVLQLCQACAESHTQMAGGVTISVKGVEIQVSSRLVEALVCPRCGLTFTEFQSGGKFGCASCYDAFAPRLDRLMKRIHGTARHVGEAGSVGRSEPAVSSAKHIKTGVSESSLSDLEEQLRQAVAAEAFEEAAGLRDRISALKAARKQV